MEPSLLAHKPDNISHAEAASFSLAGLTAYAALLRGGGLKKGAGQRVFIVSPPRQLLDRTNLIEFYLVIERR